MDLMPLMGTLGVAAEDLVGGVLLLGRHRVVERLEGGDELLHVLRVVVNWPVRFVRRP